MAYILQSRTDHTDAELEKEGLVFDPERVANGADVRLALWLEDKATLVPAGYDDDWATATQAARDDLRAKHVHKDSAKADKTVSVQAATTYADATAWVGMIKASIKQAPRTIREAAPKLHTGWDNVTHLAHAVETMVGFCTQHDFRVRAVRSAAAAVDGQAKLVAYQAAHTAHATASVTPAVKATHAATGLLAFELIRLSVAADDLLPPERAAKYETTSLRHPSHAHHSKPAAAVTPATPTPPGK
jgi:hypothetical protein